MSLYESIKSNQNRIAPKRKNLKESSEIKPIKLSDKYVEISVPKGSISATPSIAREINSKKPNKKIIKRVTNDGKEIKEAGEKRNRIPRNWKRIDYTLNREASSGKPGDKFTVTRDEYGRAVDTDSKGNKYQTNWSMMRSPEMVTINKIDESAEGIEEFWNKIRNKEIKVGDSIPMDNGIGSTAELIDFDGNSDYILIKHNYPNGKGFEYVSAWAPEISNGKLSWGQGHYFNEDLDAAKKHFRSHTLRQTVYESCKGKACRGKKKLSEMAMADRLKGAREQRVGSESTVVDEIVGFYTDKFNSEKYVSWLEGFLTKQINDGRRNYEFQNKFWRKASSGSSDTYFTVGFARWENPEEADGGSWGRYKGIELKDIAKSVLDKANQLFLDLLKREGIRVLNTRKESDRWGDPSIYVKVDLENFEELQESQKLKEADGWIAMFGGKKCEIGKDEAKDLWGAKQVAIKKLNVPKSKTSQLAIEPAYNDENLDKAPASKAQFESCGKKAKRGTPRSYKK